MDLRKWSLIWILSYQLIYFLHIVSGEIQIERTSYCYGDSSHTPNLLNIQCLDGGGIFLHDILVGAKPLSLGCLPEDHITSPAPPYCCTHNETDCIHAFQGDKSLYYNCNGKTLCDRLLVVRARSNCSSDYLTFTNYMTLEFYCIPPGYNFGPCNSTADCRDANAVCNKTYCACQTGYTTFFPYDDCWKDGALNGSCTGPQGCQDANTYCNSTSGRCECETGYIAYNGSCVQGGHNHGFCVDTKDCTDPNALCDKSVCVCIDGYTAFEEFDDCWRDGDVNGSCSDTLPCEDDFTVCNSTTDRCECVSGYSSTNGSCYKDGDLHGYCEDVVDCEDDHAVCVDNRCECRSGYNDINGACIKDGETGGYCFANKTCVDNNAKCDNSTNICVCVDNYTNIDGMCMKDKELGGKCNTTSSSSCTDSHAQCVTSSTDPTLTICECQIDYSNVDGVCKKDWEVGGRCNTTSTMKNCTDTLSVCTASSTDSSLYICQCVTGYSDVGGVCKKDWGVGGRCNTTTSTRNCTDSLSLCTASATDPSLFICQCVTGYSDIGGVCKKDGENGGKCFANKTCVDNNSKCDNSKNICVCVDNYTNIDSMCIKDKELGGKCNATSSSSCTDSHALCVTSSTDPTLNVCECQTDYSNVDGVCKKDWEVGGRCNTTTVTKNCTDTLSVCTASSTDASLFICQCVTGYSDIGGVCKKDGDLGGYCEVDIDCLDDNAECKNGICVCADGYSQLDGLCRKDWGLEGVCNTSTTRNCTDPNAQCVQMATNSSVKVCKCLTGFTNIKGVCKEEQHVGGRCSAQKPCLDDNTTCSDEGICVCVSGYSEVNSTCKQDGENGGICETGSQGQGQCNDGNADCVEDTANSCGGFKCDPGVCKCKAGHSIGLYGNCIKDGDLGGKCDVDRDCNDASAVCESQTKVCVCANGYTEFQGVCVKDGEPGGTCLPGGICADSHSVCINGTCLCNDKRNYILEGGVCQKEDNHVNGNCTQNSCVDPHAVCSNGICVCGSGYSQINGNCSPVSTPAPSVSSCNGSSPYNQLTPDCQLGYIPIITDTYQRVKPASDNCPAEMNTYSESNFTRCCSYDGDDCRLDGSGADACTSADLAGSYTMYIVVEFICVHDGSKIEVDDDNTISNNPVYITNPGSSTGTSAEMCSVTASCRTDIYVNIVYAKLADQTQCNKVTLVVSDGSRTLTFNCTYNGYGTDQAVYTTSSGFFNFTLNNPDDGNFVLKIEGNKTTADLEVACGNNQKTRGPDSFPSCDPEAGMLGGACSSTLDCQIAHTVCSNGICQCNSGYTENNGQCVENAIQDPQTGKDALLAVIVPVVALVALAVAGVAAWLLRERIRKRCSPEKDAGAGGIVPVQTGPSPMNVKYTGKGVPSDVKIPKVMPPPWQNTGWSPMNEKFRGTLPNGIKAPKVLPPLKTKVSVVKPLVTKGPQIMTDYLIQEQLDAEKAKHDNNLKSEEEPKRKHKKKNKRFKKASIGIMAKRTFELPTHPPPNPKPGVYLPNENFYMNGGPHSFSQSVSMQNGHPAGRLPSLNGQPSFHNSLMGGHNPPPMPWSSPAQHQPQDLRSSVRSLSRRTSILDIASVDDPTNVEHAELEEE